MLELRWITVSTATLCLSVAIGSSIVTGDMNGPTKELGIKQEITNGFTWTELSVAPNGEVLQTNTVFAFPEGVFGFREGVFVNASREALGRWKFEPLADTDDARVGNVCVDLTFRLN